MAEASDTDIANQALSHIGVSKFITNLLTEQSNEARAARAFFNTARNALLRDFPWPVATRFVQLGLVRQDPTDEWSFEYAYPSDALRLLRIVTGTPNDNQQSRLKYRIIHGDASTTIYANESPACMEYITRLEDTSRFTDDMVLALGYRLAVYIAPRLAKNPQKYMPNLFRLYRQELMAAAANSQNEESPHEEPSSDFERARGSSGLSDPEFRVRRT